MYREEFKQTLAKLRPVIGELADAFWLTTLLDPDQEKDIRAVAQAMAAELLEETYTGKHILLEPPPKEKAEGEYPFGWVTYTGKPVCRFGLRENELVQHLLILGRSGAGKTNVGHILVWNLLRAGKPFIVLDWRRNYRHLTYRSEGKEILLFRLGEEESLGFNPLCPPPNLSPTQCEAYLRDIVSVICTTCLPGHQLLSTRGVEYLFLKAIEYCQGEITEPLTFNGVRHYVDRYRARSREIDWLASAQNVLFKLTTGPIGRVLNARGAVTLPDILSKPVILELDTLGSETDRAFFTQTFLLWLYYHRLAQQRSHPFKHGLIVEEAHHLFLRRHDGNQSVNDLMLRQMRDLGEAMVLIDQNPSLLSTPSLGNTGVTICLNLKHKDDIEAAGKALTLPREHYEDIGKLPVGEGIVKAPRFSDPFLVRFPCFPIRSPEHPPAVKGSAMGSVSLQQTVEELRLALSEAIRALPGPDREKDKEEGIGIKERSLLMDMAQHPLSVVTERFGRLGFSAHTGTEIKRKLLERGLIEQENVRVPNGTVTLLKFTGQGRNLAASLGTEVKALPKNGSLEHEYWKELISRRYRKMGYEVEKEVQTAEGHSIDLVATKGSERVAIEVETGKANVEANLKKCNEAGFDKVVSVALDRAVKREIERKVEATGLGKDTRIVIAHVDELLKN